MPYFSKQYHAPGTEPGTLVALSRVEDSPECVNLVSYTETRIEEDMNATITASQPSPSAEGVIWIHVQGTPKADTLRYLQEFFDIHPLALEDVLNTGQRPKMELYDDQFFLTASLPTIDDQDVKIKQVSLFLGEGYVISFFPDAIDPFESVRNRLRNRKNRIRKRKADYLLYALLDTVIDQGFPLMEYFAEEIEDLEVDLLDRPETETLGRIHQIRQDLLMQRRLLWPHRDVVNQLLREEHDLIEDETRLFIRDCYDHSLQIMDLLEVYREMLASLLDIYLSTAAHRLNEVIRLLTIISTIFIPLTFLGGVYGMNFGRGPNPSPWAMPELDWYYGYPLVLLIMLGIAAGMVAYFKHKRWL